MNGVNARYMAPSPPIVTMYMASCPDDWQPGKVEPTVTSPSVCSPVGAAERDLAELLDAVTALPLPVTEAGMRLAATVAKLRERQRQRLGLPEAAK